MDHLKETIRQYEEQLLQVQQALATTNTSDRQDLLSLENDLKEVISLTKESLGSDSTDDKQVDVNTVNKSSKSSLEDEYDLFKAEMEKLDQKNDQADDIPESLDQSSNSLEDDLKALEGTKCRAPHGSSWGGTGYHNAMICSIHQTKDQISDLNDIMLRVLFINPTHKEMIPCPYFLEGSCKFSEDQCHFSHGELVPFTSIQDYKEPDYTTIKMGSRVFAKQKNKLWHRCVVLKTPEDSSNMYQVKFEASGNIIEVEIDDLLPLDDADLNMSDSSDESDYEQETNTCENEKLIHKSLLSNESTQGLGSWEKHTRGIGSKLMAQMGYITGTGLGKRSDGRIDIVEATVLPAGKSLDHCMTLRENAGGDKDLFSVEKKMQKQLRKLEQQRQKEYLREKQKEKNNIFNFLNTAIGDKNSGPKPGSSKTYKDLKKESNKNLTLATMKIENDISRLEKESSKFQKIMSQCPQGSIQYNTVFTKFNQAQSQISSLKASGKRISAEQSQRKFKAQMTEF